MRQEARAATSGSAQAKAGSDGGGASKRAKIGDLLFAMAKKHPGKLFTYQEIAKEVYERRITPRKEHTETKSIANSGASVREYLQKKYNVDLKVENGSMRALVTDDDKARNRLPQTEARVASAHRQHARSVAIVDPRKLKDQELRTAFETRHAPIAKFGDKIAGLLPTRKPDKD